MVEDPGPIKIDNFFACITEIVFGKGRELQLISKSGSTFESNAEHFSAERDKGCENVTDNYRRLATFVDRILRGEKPSDLPIQFPVKFELAINLKTAKELSLTIPPTLLATADEVIE